MSEVVIFRGEGGKSSLNVRLDGETVWLTVQQMADLFGSSRRNIAEHLQNVYSDGELEQSATWRNFRQVRNEGAREVGRDVAHYNLDAILSVGYRVSSKQAVQFRQWATSVLRDHLVQGFTLNAERLEARGIKEAQAALALLSSTIRNQADLSPESRGVLDLIERYAQSWTTLLRYDDGSLEIPQGTPPKHQIDYDMSMSHIAIFKRFLASHGEASDHFGRERGDAFSAIVGNIEQEIFGEPCYKSVEEKAANLLYFVIKDHPFSDGNKRIGGYLFLRYLAEEGVNHGFGPDSIPSLVVMIAQSDASAKDMTIRLIMSEIANAAPSMPAGEPDIDASAFLGMHP